MTNHVLLRRRLAHGHCVILRFGEDTDFRAQLTEAEVRFADTLPERRRGGFVAGRAALRLALRDAGCEAGDLLPSERGGPQLPAGFVGSISHKDAIAVGLADAHASRTCGVDLEVERVGRPDISRHVLTDDEREADGHLADDERMHALVLRFSIKEAIYKAIDPFLRRYVGFKEVAVNLHASGTADVEMRLPATEPRLVVEARWERVGEAFLATARAELR
jgi:4'-phosphopantetheinyl transferase EntD